MTRPPRLATWLLSHFRPRGDLDLLLGDLHEEYADMLERSGRTEARRWYWRQTLRSLPNLTYDLGNWNLRMFKTYLTIALRHLKRHPGYSAINITGLAVGLAACLLIGLFAVQKLAYDRFHPDADRIYRVYLDDGKGPKSPQLPLGLAHALEAEIPAAEHVTEVKVTAKGLFEYDGERFFAPQLRTDSSFLDVFSGFQMLRGNAAEALTAPNQLVVTERFAERLFGVAEAVGKVVRVDGRADYEVVGMLADPPVVSHLDFDAVLSLSDGEWSARSMDVMWMARDRAMYIKAAPGITADALQRQVTAFETAAEKPTWMQDSLATVYTQPLTRVHLHSADFSDYIGPQSDVRHLYLFGAVGLLILAMACTNYINLATARGTERRREVGVRKAIGARRGQLVQQFLSESVLMVGIALVLAVGLIYAATPWINQITGAELSLAFGVDSLLVVMIMLSVGALVALGAGSYPAFYLSGFRPSSVFQKRAVLTQRRVLNPVLMVFQFVAAFILVTGVWLVRAQLTYINSQDLGFSPERVVHVQARALGEQFEAFAEQVRGSVAVEAIAEGAPLGVSIRDLTIGLNANTPDAVQLTGFTAGHSYANVMRPRLLTGRWFDINRPTDSTEAVVVTAQALLDLNVAGDPVGQPFDTGMHGERTIIGVLEDVHNASFYTPVRAAFFTLPTDSKVVNALVRLRPGQVEAGIAHLEATWNAFVPERPLNYSFLQDDISGQYQADQRLMQLFSLFSGLALLIACMGVVGLAAFSTAQRTKEIGIRKVMGASSLGLLSLLSRRYAVLLLVGSVVALPLALWAAQQWLQRFAYHVELSPWLFAGTLLTVGLLVMLAVSTQVWRATQLNPADALRHE
ncbi:MAG: ABC transporter permease [Bacteroidota bacterium]